MNNEDDNKNDTLFIKIRFPIENKITEKRFKISLQKTPKDIMRSLEILTQKSYSVDEYVICVSPKAISKFETDSKLINFRSNGSILKIPNESILLKYKPILLKIVSLFLFTLSKLLNPFIQRNMLN